MKFLIIDDHPMLREGVAAVLRQLGDDVEVLHANDGHEGLATAADQRARACARASGSSRGVKRRASGPGGSARPRAAIAMPATPRAVNSVSQPAPAPR